MWIEKTASIEEILKIYSPAAIIGVYERFEPYMKRHLALYGFDFYLPFKSLYLEVKRIYPDMFAGSRSLEETLERTRIAREKMNLTN